MSLDHTFNPIAAAPGFGTSDQKLRRKPPAPFSLRLSREEKARLTEEAAGAPLGTYIKAKVLGEALPLRMRRSGLPIVERTALAQLVAILGRSRIASNLNQLAHLANMGALPFTPEIEEDLREACREVREIRRLLLVALGLKPGDAP